MPDPTLYTIRTRGCTKTSGLVNLGQKELELCYKSESLRGIARDLADALMRCIESSDKRVMAGEKMGWATSVIRFDAREDFLHVSSLDLKRDEFTEHSDDLLEAWQRQRQLCKEHGSRYIGTALDHMIVASSGVLDGLPISDGVRYPFQHPDSGWWLLGSEYNGDIEFVRRVHVGDLLLVRDDVRPYLALEPGFCFSQARTPSVWFDEAVAKESSS